MTPAFAAIHGMTHGIPDPTLQELFLATLTLDDWVTIYRLCQAAEALGVVSQSELSTELEVHGIYRFCLNLAHRIIAQQFGPDAGAQYHDSQDRVFNLMAHLQQGLLKALTPSISLVSS